jgi:hypothetical protein
MWNLRPDERLREWRSFRNSLSALDLETAIKNTVHLWSYAPYVTHYLSADLPEDWPDPWILVHENYYCDLAKALGMLYTLYLSDHYNKTITELEIRIYKDSTTNDWLNTVWVNQGKYILNFSFDSIVNKNLVDENLKLKYTYTVDSLKLGQY